MGDGEVVSLYLHACINAHMETVDISGFCSLSPFCFLLCENTARGLTSDTSRLPLTLGDSLVFVHILVYSVLEHIQISTAPKSL